MTGPFYVVSLDGGAVGLLGVYADRTAADLALGRADAAGHRAAVVTPRGDGPAEPLACVGGLSLEDVVNLDVGTRRVSEAIANAPRPDGPAVASGMAGLVALAWPGGRT